MTALILAYALGVLCGLLCGYWLGRRANLGPEVQRLNRQLRTAWGTVERLREKAEQR